MTCLFFRPPRYGRRLRAGYCSLIYSASTGFLHIAYCTEASEPLRSFSINSGYRYSGHSPATGLKIDNELAIRIAIAGVKGFTETGTTLDQMALSALRASDSRLIGFINQLGMFTFRIAAIANEHPQTPPRNTSNCTARWALLPLQHLNDMPVRLAFQGTNIVTVRIMRTAEKRAMFRNGSPVPAPALRAGSFLRTETVLIWS